MKHPRVLCIGEMLFDRLSDQPGRSLEQVESWTDYPGGAPANVACALVKLGTPAGFIGCIGKDEPGDSLVQLLEEIGVDLTGVQRHPTAPTRIVYVVRDASGDRSFAGFGDRSTSEFADTYLQSDRLPVDLVPAADFLVVGSLELAYPDSRKAVTEVLSQAKQSNTMIFVDVNRRDMFWLNPGEALEPIRELVKDADFLKLTDEEADWLFNTTDPEAIAQSLGDRTKGVLVTAGERGCSYWLAGNKGERSAFDIAVEDTTGAGDSFTAGIIHQLCQNGIESLTHPETAQSIVEYASAVGALTVTKPGAIAAQPTAAEVDKFLKP